MWRADTKLKLFFSYEKMPGEETPPPDGGACGSEVVKTTVTMTPHIKAVQGQLKAAKVRVLFSTVLVT